MDTKECILTRRSVRRFTNEPVLKADLEEIIELAAYAPSWKNSQTTRYTAIYNRGTIENIADNAVLNFEFNIKSIRPAPVLVIVTTIEGRSGYERDGSHSTSQGDHWQSFDAGIAAQTFCLAAHELGYGTCIMGIYDEAKVKEIAGIREGESVSALIILGHPAESVTAPKRKSVEELLTVIE